MATSVAKVGGLSMEFVGSRVLVLSRQRSKVVAFSPRRSCSAIVTRSAAFLCVAFAGNPGGSQGDGAGAGGSEKGGLVSKKQKYFRKRRSALKKTKKISSTSSGGGGGDVASGEGLGMAAAAAASNDLLALISNSAVPVFSDEPEGPEVVEFQKAGIEDSGEEDLEDSGSNDVDWGFCWHFEVVVVVLIRLLVWKPFWLLSWAWCVFGEVKL